MIEGKISKVRNNAAEALYNCTVKQCDSVTFGLLFGVDVDNRKRISTPNSALKKALGLGKLSTAEVIAEHMRMISNG